MIKISLNGIKNLKPGQYCIRVVEEVGPDNLILSSTQCYYQFLGYFKYKYQSKHKKIVVMLNLETNSQEEFDLIFFRRVERLYSHSITVQNHMFKLSKHDELKMTMDLLTK